MDFDTVQSNVRSCYPECLISISAFGRIFVYIALASQPSQEHFLLIVNLGAMLSSNSMAACGISLLEVGGILICTFRGLGASSYWTDGYCLEVGLP